MEQPADENEIETRSVPSSSSSRSHLKSKTSGRKRKSNNTISSISSSKDVSGAAARKYHQLLGPQIIKTDANGAESLVKIKLEAVQTATAAAAAAGDMITVADSDPSAEDDDDCEGGVAAAAAAESSSDGVYEMDFAIDNDGDDYSYNDDGDDHSFDDEDAAFASSAAAAPLLRLTSQEQSLCQEFGVSLAGLRVSLKRMAIFSRNPRRQSIPLKVLNILSSSARLKKEEIEDDIDDDSEGYDPPSFGGGSDGGDSSAGRSDSSEQDDDDEYQPRKRRRRRPAAGGGSATKRSRVRSSRAHKIEEEDGDP